MLYCISSQKSGRLEIEPDVQSSIPSIMTGIRESENPTPLIASETFDFMKNVLCLLLTEYTDDRTRQFPINDAVWMIVSNTVYVTCPPETVAFTSAELLSILVRLLSRSIRCDNELETVCILSLIA